MKIGQRGSEKGCVGRKEERARVRERERAKESEREAERDSLRPGAKAPKYVFRLYYHHSRLACLLYTHALIHTQVHTYTSHARTAIVFPLAGERALSREESGGKARLKLNNSRRLLRTKLRMEMVEKEEEEQAEGGGEMKRK